MKPTASAQPELAAKAREARSSYARQANAGTLAIIEDLQRAGVRGLRSNRQGIAGEGSAHAGWSIDVAAYPGREAVGLNDVKVV